MAALPSGVLNQSLILMAKKKKNLPENELSKGFHLSQNQDDHYAHPFLCVSAHQNS